MLSVGYKVGLGFLLSWTCEWREAKGDDDCCCGVKKRRRGMAAMLWCLVMCWE